MADFFGLSHAYLSHAWEVLLLFLIPIGGGIPAGVILAQKYSFSWRLMSLFYFISDVILACVFEPIMLLFIKWSHKSAWLSRFREALSQSTKKTVAHYGLNPGPFTLVMITFGTDPMTGRSVAKAAGHNFLTGWALTIAGDMLFFGVLMASTLWLNNILGDGTVTALLIMVAMVVVPSLIRRARDKWRGGARH